MPGGALGIPILEIHDEPKLPHVSTEYDNHHKSTENSNNKQQDSSSNNMLRDQENTTYPDHGEEKSDVDVYGSEIDQEIRRWAQCIGT